jgi:hypothetical protein
MPNIVYSYIIKSLEYNKLQNQTIEYFGLTNIFINAKQDTPFYKKLLKKELSKKENIILNDFIRRYEDYYFDETEIYKYEKQIKLIDKLAEEETNVNIKRAIIKRKEKYIIVKTDKQKYLHNLATRFSNSTKLVWIGKVKDSLNKHKNDEDVISYVIEKYVNNENNKDKIIYHNLKKSKEDLNYEQRQRNIKWIENNKERYKELHKNWCKENADKMNEYVKKYLYYKKLKPWSKDEVKEKEQNVIDIISDNNKKQSINLMCKMIIEDKQNHIIIKKVIKELQQETYFKRSISSRLSYLKKIKY